MAVTTLTSGVPEVSITGNPSGATAGTTLALPVSSSKNYFAVGWQLVFTGGPSAVSFNLEVSIDGTNFVSIDSATTTTGWVKFVNNVVARFIRISQASRTGGTGVTGTILIN